MIEILPETESGTLVVKATETLTHQDYQNIFIPQLERRLDKFGKIRLLFHLAENFKGWEWDAAWDDAVFGAKHQDDFEKIAVVGDQSWAEWVTRFGSHFMEGQVVAYPSAEFKDALDWVKR